MMRRPAQALLVAFIFVISGCSVPVDSADNPEELKCTDFRDNRQFTMYVHTVERATFTLNDVCFVAQTSEGEKTLCKSHEAWLKCE